MVEQLAFLAREDKRVDKRSGVSQRLPISVLENVVSNAERRALETGEAVAVPRILDIYAALPSITGKLELEYEGELKGGDTVARELIRTAVGKVYDNYLEGANVSQIVQWFDLGGTLKLDEAADSAAMVKMLSSIQGLMDKLKALKIAGRRAGRGERRGGRVHPGRAVRAPAHQPQRGARLRGGGAQARAAFAEETPRTFRRQYN